MSSLRDLERRSIRSFVQGAADGGYLSGRVLDYGCGKQPYRDIVEAVGGEYHGYDRKDFAGNVSEEDIGFLGDPCVAGYPMHARREDGKGFASQKWDAVLCTQVVQYLRPGVEWEDPALELLAEINFGLKIGGVLVLTYPTNWAEVEDTDLQRYTKAGMEERLLNGTAGPYEIIRHEPREIVAVTLDGENLYAGYGVIARA